VVAQVVVGVPSRASTNISLLRHESALKLMQTECNMMCARSKHIDLQYWLIVDHIMKKDTEVKFIAGKNMLAD
jgi:hypothetical protein